MNRLLSVDLLSGPLGQRLTLSLLHFLWQGAALAGLCVLLNGALYRARPAGRYGVSFAIFLAMALAPCITFIVVVPSVLEPARIELTNAAAAAPVAKSNNDHVVKATQSGNQETTLEHADAKQERQGTPPTGPLGSWKWRVELERLQPWVIGSWLTGVLLFGSRLAVAVFGLRRLRGGYGPLPDELLRHAKLLAARLGLARLPRIGQSTRIAEALLVGLFRPLVLLPASWVMDLPPATLEAILAHELAHAHRWDLWVNLFQRVVETLLFYHPCVWWLSRQLRIERELCCDALAVAATGQRLEYVQALEQVALLQVSSRSSQLAISMRGKEMLVLRRVRTLLGLSPETQAGNRGLAGLLALLVPIALTWMPGPPIPAALPVERSAVVEPMVALEILSMHGEPMPQAEVSFYRHGVELGEHHQTDEAGVCYLPAQWAARGSGYVAVAHLPGHIGWCDLAFGTRHDDGSEPIIAEHRRLTLVPTRRITRGAFFDPQGQPLANLPVQVKWVKHPVNGLLRAEQAANLPIFSSTVTDAMGRFVLEVPADARMQVRSNHPTWVTGCIPVETARETSVRLCLEAAGAIRGKVCDPETGAPLAGIPIVADRQRPNETGERGRTVTNAQGEYLISSLRQGIYNVFVFQPADGQRLTGLAREAVWVIAGQQKTVDLLAGPGQLVTGTVRDEEEDEPLSGIRVGYWGPAQPKSGTASMSVTSDAQGRFNFVLPPGDSEFFVAECERSPGPHRRIRVTVGPGQEQPNVALKTAARKRVISKPNAVSIAASTALNTDD